MIAIKHYDDNMSAHHGSAFTVSLATAFLGVVELGGFAWLIADACPFSGGELAILHAVLSGINFRSQ
jgi:hypothetical protein